MRPAKLAAALFALLAVGLAAAQAKVLVIFENQARYDNGNLRSGARREAIVREFDRHFRTLARRSLPPGRSLRITVLDLDLAGIREPFRTGLSEPPILSDATPPRFKLRYSLTEGGRVLASGTEVVRDANYLWNPSARLSSERFVHEKTMLARWFDERIVKRRPPRR